MLIDAIDLLPQLFGEVRVPPAVMQELQHPRTPEPVKCWAQSPPEWLIIQAPSAVAPHDLNLDPGEAEAVALALELHAAAILVDEKKGRRIAATHGLATLGTITVLELTASETPLPLQRSRPILTNLIHALKALHYGRPRGAEPLAVLIPSWEHAIIR